MKPTPNPNSSCFDICRPRSCPQLRPRLRHKNARLILRQQFSEVQAKQTELETRLQQLEEDLKPENIEKLGGGR